MLYEFKLGPNPAEATKNICREKGERTVDHSTITGCLKKFHSDRKKLDGQLRIGQPKTVDSEANLVSSI